MFNVVAKKGMLALMLIVFFGQVMAYGTTIPCQTAVDPHMNQLHSTVVTASASHHLEDNTTDCCGISCCDVDCGCIASGCSFLAFLHADIVSTKALVTNNVFYIEPFDHIPPVTNLLYRPPIFT